jgi:asparagine synthase (glutamine-hydrolysing)
MCGITGIFNVDGKPVAINTLKKMTDVIAHRGPDGEGYWTNSFIGFGHRRLAIIDLSPLGHQPMKNNDETMVITFNGEIYNFHALRKELQAKGHTFRSKTDTEVLLKTYQEWGDSCIHRLNGMFAFAIWDSRRNRLFAARDRYGIKPFYYYYANGVLLFASEVKAILEHPDVTASVSLPALNEYFSFQNIFSDQTLFEGIKLLPPAHSLAVSLGDPRSFRIERYWDYDFRDGEAGIEQETLEELNRLFEQAVSRQLVSDVEVGAYLSGGIDSGAITCIAARNFKNLKSFTCGFDLSSASGLELGFDEREKAEYLSNIYKTEHYEVVLKAGDMERVMPQLVWHLEDLRVGQSYPNYYVSRLASKFVKVILSGAGGDEMFGGYPWRYYRAAGSNSSEEYVEKYYNYWQRLIDDPHKPEFFQPDVYAGIEKDQTRSIFKSIVNGKPFIISNPEEYVNRSLKFESKTFLHGLLIVEDKLSMAHSLESRVPFLDNDLVNFAMRVPVHLKLRDLRQAERINENVPPPLKFVNPTDDGKVILRKALSRYVPEGYVNGRKQGFSAPDGSWFRGESIEYIKDLLCNRKARVYDYIQPGAAHALLNDHFTGRVNRRLLIWSLLCFEWWLKTFLPTQHA